MADSGLREASPALPNGVLYRVKQIQNISKQSLKLVPLSGQTQVSNSQKIIVALPPNSLVDLSTFELNFVGATMHRGNGSTGWAGGGAGLATNVGNYVQKAYFPRNTASLIENLEVKCNGRSIQNINQYNYLYNIIYDYTCGTDALTKNRINCNADPSCKTLYYNGQPRRYAGYPVGNTSDTTTNSFLDQDNYSIRQWLGFLGGNTSTTIIDTSLYGDITIEITLAPLDCQMLSNAVGTNSTAITSATATDSGLTTTASTAAAATAAQGSGYTLTNIGFIITRYDMPSSYYQAVASVLEAGAVFRLYYPNYSVFMGTAQGLPKGGTTRFNLSTQSLDMVIGTFRVPSIACVNEAPILGNPSTNFLEPLSNLQADGEFGNSTYTFQNALIKGCSKTLNNSKYFLRNGDGINYNTWIVGAVRLIPEYINEQFNGVLRAFNMQSDVLSGLYPGIQSLSHYQTQFYAHILSLNVTNEHDMYTVSGLNCSSTPISIGWEVAGSSSATIANVDAAATSFGNIFQTSNYNCTPTLFACYSSHLEVSAGRNITVIL